MSPGRRPTRRLRKRSAGSAGPLVVDEIASPLGNIVLIARESRLVMLEFANVPAGRGLSVEGRNGAQYFERACDPYGLSSRVRAYFSGDLGALADVEIEPAGTPFQLAVWAALRRVPPGSVITYAELARAAGHPQAIRAAGAANGRNAVAIAVPCHRVIGSDGSLTGYAGGLRRKRWLLRHEGAGADRRLADVSASS
jgi:methylated-DNA-[protein]-cysteine S-methyltransferase